MSVQSTVQKAADTGRTFVCPRCRRPFQELGAPAQCPDDGTYLIRQRDLDAADRDPMVGRSLEGRYTITSRLGAGSMGTVYRARQHAMGREIAIKILRGDRAMDETAKARFLREARANSLLASPNTVTVFDFGEAQSGELYLAMELLEGESVGQRLARMGRLRTEDAIETARQALRSLAEAHAKGIVHRDLKPDNLFYAKVLSSGRSEELVKVLDFGIAKMMREDSAHLNAIETQAGTVFGTPRYMSPEQAQGKPLDARSDLYSLGVILYQMLTGKPPFTDDDAIVVMARHIKTAPKSISEVCPEAGVAPDLERLVMRVLAKDPNDRPITADVFSNELARVLESVVPSTSGVRRSMPPPSDMPASIMSLPAPIPSATSSDLLLPQESAGRRNVLIGIFLIALALVMGIVVVLNMKRPPPEPIASQRGPAIHSAVEPPTTTQAPGAAPAQAMPGSANAASADPPAISPDALPKARPSATIPIGPAGRPFGRPPGGAAGRPRPSPSASATGYGILD